MFSYFTELNRKRPPLDDLDIVSFTNSGLVHAGDDRSATEGLEALPYIAKSVEAIAGGKPWHAGPSALAMRGNPYGESPAENPDNIRQAMNKMDPRQRGLLGAAWYLGYFAHMARGGASWVSLGAGVGEHGLAHAAMPYAQPWFDEAGGVYPTFHVFRGLAKLAGMPMLETRATPIRNLQAVAAERPDGKREIWVANLTGEPLDIALQGGPQEAQAFMLDADTFARLAADSTDAGWSAVHGTPVGLEPYGIMRIVGR